MKKKWNKDVVISELKKLQKELGRLPKSSDCEALTCAAKKQFLTWNNALHVTFGVLNNYRYSNISDEKLLEYLYDFIKKYQRLPLREEFKGNGDYPYFECYFIRFNKNKWSDVLNLLDLSNITYYNSTKHGTGKIFYYNNICYLSHQEYLIGKYLTENNIKFEKEVSYSNCKFIFDFYLNEFNTYIEYYGRSNFKDYLDTIDKKRLFYNNRNVIEIFKHDNTINKLSKEVQRLQSSQVNNLKV
jgi:hypothetical protein